MRACAACAVLILSQPAGMHSLAMSRAAPSPTGCWHPPPGPRSFGFVPSKPELDAAAALVQPALAQQLRPWEVDILLWGAARLGYHPGPGIMQARGG